MREDLFSHNAMGTEQRAGGAAAPDPPPAGAVGDGAPARWQPSPWVLERRGRNRFQVQPCPVFEDRAPIERALAYARLAEELGFDAVSFGDHPMLLDCWVWLAAAAATTRRIRLGPGVACAPCWPPTATVRVVPSGATERPGAKRPSLHLTQGGPWW
jgi:hypothetical protein